jgi:signal transduction histidine kinase
MQRLPSRAFTIKSVLVLGFGLVVGLWAFAGLYLTKRMEEVHSGAAAISMRYMQAQETLSTIRSQVLLASVYVRDALLDPNPGTVEDYRRRMEDSLAQVDTALESYVPVIGSAAELEGVDRLRAEIEHFRTTMLEVLASDSGHWRTNAQTLLRSRIMPKRELALRVSDEAQAVNRLAYVRQQSAFADAYDITQTRLWQGFGVILLASLGISVFAIAYATRLEGRLQAQRIKDIENTSDLQRLSAQLVNAQEDERRNIARELHDEVGQALLAIKVEVACAQRHTQAAGVDTKVFAGVNSLTENALQTVRDLSRILRPAILDDLGLLPALETHLVAFANRHHLRAEFHHDQFQRRLSPAIELAAFRIVQEALTNIAKHAKASVCRVSVRRQFETVVIAVEDDGIGFDVKTVTSGAQGGLGLLGIRERATHLGGTVRLETMGERGARVRVELPARWRSEIVDVDRLVLDEPMPGSKGANG